MDKISLFIHNGGYIFSGLTTLIMGFFVLARNRKVFFHKIYFISNLFFSAFAVFYLLGTNTADPNLSRFYCMFTLVNLFTVTTNAHMIWEFLGLGKKLKAVWVSFYTIAVMLFVFFLYNPNLFLLRSKPFLYLPNYFNPGEYYWLFVTFFTIVATFFIGTLFKSWLGAVGNEKTRVSYFLIAFLWAYCSGSIAFLPVFGINADPIFSAFIGIHVVILAYAILNYKLLDLNVAAARAVNFSLFTVLAGLLIVAGNWIGNYASMHIAGFPDWIVPLFSGIAVAIIGFIVMRRLREADMLKYEFINNVSHKFRTPLTHIRWISEDLREENDQKTRDRQVEQIQYATMRLFELTNIVIDAAKDTTVESIYHLAPFDIAEVVDDMIDAHHDQIMRKHLKINTDYAKDLPPITADKTRLRFALQIFFENSIVYTPDSGSIRVKVAYDNVANTFHFTIKDSGIGIEKSDIPNVFNKFFRTANARLTDTEGMGIGLYMARKIILKHNGNITVDSEGTNMGTAFSFTIPQGA